MPTKPEYFKAAHQPARAEDRPSSYQRGYDRPWKRLRDAHLQDNVFCTFCNDFAVLVDHIQPVAVKPHLRLVRSNLRSCCTGCHAKLTTNFKLTGINEMPAHSQPQTRQTPIVQGFLISGGQVHQLG